MPHCDTCTNGQYLILKKIWLWTIEIIIFLLKKKISSKFYTFKSRALNKKICDSNWITKWLFNIPILYIQPWITTSSRICMTLYLDFPYSWYKYLKIRQHNNFWLNIYSIVIIKEIITRVLLPLKRSNFFFRIFMNEIPQNVYFCINSLNMTYM